MSEDNTGVKEEEKQAPEEVEAPATKKRGRPVTKKTAKKKTAAKKKVAKTEEKEAQTDDSCGEFIRLRDSNGLLIKKEYKFTEEGFVDWRAMIPEKYIVLNEETCAAAGIDVSAMTDEEQVEFAREQAKDDQLLVLLAGYKELAKIRGYISIEPKVDSYEDKAVAHCEIQWTPNFENPGFANSVTSVATATPENTHGIFSNFLESIAENRAFSRAVRTSLGIHILSEAEVTKGGDSVDGASSKDTEPTESPDASVRGALKSYLKKDKISFATLKSAMVKKNAFNGQEREWDDVDDMPAPCVLEVLDKLKKNKATKAKKASG